MGPAYKQPATLCSTGPSAAPTGLPERFQEHIRPDDEERKMIATLVAISAGATDLTKLNVPAEVGRKLLQCYDDLGKAWS